MDQSQVAKVYAGALLEIGQEKKSSDELETELKSFVDSFREDKEIWAFLTSPRVPKANKVSAIEKATAGKASKEITSLLCLLLRNDRISYINEIYNQFRNLNDKVKGLIRAKVYTAAPLSNEDKEGIVSWFKSSLNSAVELDAITVAGGKVGSPLSKDGSFYRRKLIFRVAIQQGDEGEVLVGNGRNQPIRLRPIKILAEIKRLLHKLYAQIRNLL